MWWDGQQRVDRARLRQHAAEQARAELEGLRRPLAKSAQEVRYAREKLRTNVSEKGPNKGRELSPQRRLEFERCIENAKRLTPERRARMAELDALLADEHALARQWMGCARTAEARA
jgi:hypothetical protein